MRKTLLALLFFLTAVGASAQTGQRTFTTTVVANDVGISNIGSGIQYHQLSWNPVGAVPTCQVRLMGSVDNVTFGTTIIANQACTTAGSSTVATASANYTRIEVTTKSGAGSAVIHWNGFNSAPAGGGVTSLNTLTGAITLAAGAGISLTPVGNTITIASTGGSISGCASGQVLIATGATSAGCSAALTSSGGGISQTIASQATIVRTLTNATFPGTTMTETLGNFGNYQVLASYSPGVFTDFGMNYFGSGGDFGIDSVSAPNASQILLHGSGLIDFFSTANGFLFTGPPVNASRFDTTPNCVDPAGIASCSSASVGAVVVDAGNTSVVVSTTAVTAASRIFLQFDTSLNTNLGIATCNATVALPTVTARTAGTSFTITVPVAPAVTPACYSYLVMN